MKKIMPLIIMAFLWVHCEKDLLPEFSTFTDPRDGYTYQTVAIGSQVWLAENLRYLPVLNHPEDQSSTVPKYYVYGYFGTNMEKTMSREEYETSGVLYNLPAALEACPEGWHLPGEEDCKELTRFVGRTTELHCGPIITGHWTDWAPTVPDSTCSHRDIWKTEVLLQKVKGAIFGASRKLLMLRVEPGYGDFHGPPSGSKRVIALRIKVLRFAV